MPQEFADGIDDVGNVQVTRRNLMEHWGEQKEVVLVHQYHVSIQTAFECFFQLCIFFSLMVPPPFDAT